MHGKFPSSLYTISTPAYDALNADLTNEGNRKNSYSLLYMGVNIGFAIGPIIGGFLYNDYLTLVFIGDAITTLLALLLIALYIKEPSRQIDDDFKKEESAEDSTLRVILKRPILILFPLMMLLFQFAYSQWTFTVPVHLGDLFKEDGAKLYGFLGGLNGFVVITFTPILTYLTKNYRSLTVMSLGGLSYGLSFVICALGNYKILFFIGIFVLTIGEVLIAINSQAFIANNTPPSHRGRISSIIPMISGTGFALGPMIMGDVIDDYGIFIAWMVITSICITGSIGMILIKKLKNVNDPKCI